MRYGYALALLDLPLGLMRGPNALKNQRWLLIFFDPKLTFRAHVDKACAKARKAAMGMHMLANTVCSLHQGHMRRLYISCILPILLYASPV